GWATATPRVLRESVDLGMLGRWDEIGVRSRGCHVERWRHGSHRARCLLGPYASRKEHREPVGTIMYDATLDTRTSGEPRAGRLWLRLLRKGVSAGVAALVLSA